MCLKHFIGFKLKSYVHLIRGGSMNLDQALDQAEDFRLSGAYDQAKTSYDAIISLGHTKHIAHSHALRGLGEIYRMLENFEASEDLYKKAIDGYLAKHHLKGLGYAYLGLGQLNRHQNKTSDAKHNIETAANYFSECNDQYGQADAHIEMGHLYLLDFNYALSKIKFKQANEIYALLNDTWGSASAKLGLGKAVLKEREYINSEKELGSALELFTSIGDKLGKPMPIKNWEIYLMH